MKRNTLADTNTTKINRFLKVDDTALTITKFVSFQKKNSKQPGRSLYVYAYNRFSMSKIAKTAELVRIVMAIINK